MSFGSGAPLSSSLFTKEVVSTRREDMPPTPPHSVSSPSSRSSLDGVAASEDGDSPAQHPSNHRHGGGHGSPTDSTDSGGWDVQSEIASPAHYFPSPTTYSDANQGRGELSGDEERTHPPRFDRAAVSLSPTIGDASELFTSSSSHPHQPSSLRPSSSVHLPTSPPLQPVVASFEPALPHSATTSASLDLPPARTDAASKPRANGSASPALGLAGTGAGADGMSAATASPKLAGSPVRRYDPFAPLSPTRTAFPFATPPSTSATPPRYVPPSARPRSPSPAVNKPADPPAPSPFVQPSLARDNRPSSLYLPLETPPTKMDATGMTPTWPFGTTEHEQAFREAHESPPSSAPTPSSIHPSYADQHTLSNGIGGTSPKQRPAVSPRNGHSPLPDEGSFRRSSLTDYGEAPARRPSPNPNGPPPSVLPAWSAITVNGDGNSSSGARRQPSVNPSDGAAAAKLKFEQAGAPSRHGSSFSMGTHALLSSRGSPTSRLARQLDTPTAWLVLYFSFNLGLTLFNKLVLQGFPFPWTLTGIQMLSGTIGTQVALNRGFFTQARLTTREGIIMIAFSSLYTINIAVSNLSLHLVTVPVRFPWDLNECVRALTPLATVVLSVMFLNKRPSRETYLSLLPVVFGVVFATFGEYNYTMRGLILTLLGMVLAAIKTIVTNRVQVGRLKLHPLDLLIRMSPLAFMQCVLWGWYSGELDRVRIYGATEMTRSKAIALLMNGIIAFGLNVVSFTANKKTSALTMTVAANVKQVLTIVLAVLIFHIQLNATNMFGITLTLSGGAWYAKVELGEKSRQNASLSTARLLDGGGTEKRAPS
ncbi:hypothetical protein RQP46_001170 [Phenoliferia psychrophenolica]